VLRAGSIEDFLREPFGRWVSSSATALVWCATPALCGALAWGRPTVEHAGALVSAFGGFQHPRMAERFDVVLDGSRLEGLDPDALTVLVSWLAEHRAELAARVRMQYSVRHEGLVGLTLTGILPVLGETHAFSLVDDLGETVAKLAPQEVGLADALQAALATMRDAPAELGALRDLLRSHRGAATLAEAARALAMSERALQRLLHGTGTSFRDEVRAARYAAAEALLVQGDDKVSVVARRVGLSENALSQLVRDLAGCTPAELRRRHR
jgi:AraC-like DNA-binding protein